jgi:dTDP-L-rhamnose 4-epimerase
MHVLVTGGAGFIGSHTVDVLYERGHTAVVLDSLEERVHPLRKRPEYLRPDVELIQGSVNDRELLLRALENVDAVIHLAAHQDYLPEFHKFIHVNTESTALLYELAVLHRLRTFKVVLASSQSVAGEGSYRCDKDGRILPGPRPIAQLEKGDWNVRCPLCGRTAAPAPIPDDVANPHTSYGISKYALELLGLRLGERYQIPTVAMRYTYVQGPRSSIANAYSGVLRRFALQVLNGIAPTIYEDGLQRRDYVNVRDAALANVLVLEKDEAVFQVYNVGGGRPVTVLQFAEMVLREFGSTLQPVIVGEFRVGDTRHTVSDIGRLRGLGWEPRIAAETSVAQYREWLLTQRGRAEYVLEADRVMREASVIRRVRS